MLQQLTFGGVSRISYCARCKKPLSNPVSVDAGMGPICRGHGGKEMNEICEKDDFADKTDFSVPFSEALVLRREFQDAEKVGGVFTNVPHLVVAHSPSGFEWGYGGSGPADLALNVCQTYLNSIGYQGVKTQCHDGQCWSLAWQLHQDFKWSFIANAPREGITIPMAEIKRWFDEHLTDEMKSLYANEEEL
jgi:hypothetical protein